MHLSVSLTALSASIFAALAIPNNPSIVQPPSELVSTSRINNTIHYLYDWPATPHTFTLGTAALTIYGYGQEVRPDLRPDIVHAIQIVRRYFLDHPGLLGSRPIVIASSIVRFSCEFTGPARMQGEDMWLALLPLELSYSDRTWSLREITDAEVGLADPVSHIFLKSSTQVLFIID